MLSEAFRFAGVAGTPDLDRVAVLSKVERELRRGLPQAVWEWFAVPGAVEWLADHHDNSITELNQLGLPVEGLDFADRGFLVLATDSQCCCRWVVPLGPMLPVPEPLFEAPPLGWDLGDPPVYVVPPNDVAGRDRQRFADRFSEYAYTAVWDFVSLPGEETYYDYDVPLRPGVLDKLRERMTVLPTTYAWAYTGPCEAIYRFQEPGCRIDLAVQDGLAELHINATEPARRDSLLALLAGDTQRR